MSKQVELKGKSYIGQKVSISSLGILGEVAELSKENENLITVIKVKTAQGFKKVHAADKIVESILIDSEIGFLVVFKLFLIAIKNMFKV